MEFGEMTQNKGRRYNVSC